MDDNNHDIPKKRPRRVRHFGVWKLLSILLLGALLFMIGLSLTGQKMTAPGWLTARIQGQANASLENGRISIGRLQFHVDERGVPRVLIGNLGVFDNGGGEVARLNDVGVALSLRSLLRARLKPDEIRLTGAQMTLRRRRDGQFDLSFGAGSAATGTLPGVLDWVDHAFGVAPLDQLSLLDANGLTITLEDARSARLWQMTEGSIQVRRSLQGLEMSLGFDIFNGTEELAQAIIGISTKTDDSSATLGTSFQNATARDIALQSPMLSFLGVLDAPISGALRAEIDADGALQSFAGTLEIEGGVLSPSPGAAPVHFSSAKSYFDFDPVNNKLEFSQISVESETFSASARGHAYLNDYQEGWPSSLLGQFALSDISAQPQGFYDAPVLVSEGIVDFRMRLDPFSVDIGQLVLQQGDEKLVASGRIAAPADGWQLAGDIKVNKISRDRLLTLWPRPFAPTVKAWIEKNVLQAHLSDIKAAIRINPGQAPRMFFGWDFKDSTARYLVGQPVVQNAGGYGLIDGDVFTLVFETGTVLAPTGGNADIRGTVIQVPNVRVLPATLKVDLNAKSSATAALSLLNTKPFAVLKDTPYGPDLAKGDVTITGDIEFAIKKKITKDDVTFTLNGLLEQVSSDKLVPGRDLSARRLEMIANNDFVEISGPARLGQVATNIVWHKELAAEFLGKSNASGTVELSSAFVREFPIGLPESAVTGRGLARFNLDLNTGKDTRFSLSSDMNRVGLAISQIGWSKPKNATGKLKVTGSLGETPKIDLLEIAASGLNAQGGRVSVGTDGSMELVTFARVRVGEWLDAPVVLRGRGAGRVPGIELPGGMFDIRKTAFGGDSSGASSEGGPISLNLDRVIVSEGMSLTHFVGELDSGGGMSGRFEARMNGNTPLVGQLVAMKNGTAVSIQSENAGGILRDAGTLNYANKGRMVLTLQPQKKEGVYLGDMLITNTKVKDAPGLTDLLSAISIIGLLDQMSGEGISFDEVKASFRLTPKFVHLTRSSAVGPSLGVSMDGVYNLTNSQIDMQGVVSPVYFLNGIGQLVSREGEGLFGFNFRFTGTSDEPVVSVNPLSILTPGIFRDIFRAPPPKITE